MLRPGGWLLLSEISRGHAGPIDYPTPWARTAASSFLAGLVETTAGLSAAGFTILSVRDTADEVRAFAARSRAVVEAGGKPPSRTVQLVHGDDAPLVMKNSAEAARTGAVVPIEIHCRK